MNIALVGYAVENQAAYRYFAVQGADITICDLNTEVELPEGVKSKLGEGYLDNLKEFDLIVRTVGMHPDLIMEQNPTVIRNITTAVNVFFEKCQVPIIGVTGTKGKGTTSTLIHKILEAAGKKVVLAGNIGKPMLDVLQEANDSDFAVLELSSFQLYDLKSAPHVAVCLMVVPEHLNWHNDFDDYKRSKANLFRYQNSKDVAVYNILNQASTEIAAASPTSTKLTYAVPSAGEDVPPFYTARIVEDSIYCRDAEIMNINEVKLLGRHNLENVCAAVAATWDLIDGNVEAIHSVVSSFSGLEFRLEFIRELNGVRYYNDSFSTTPETAIAALRAFEESKIVILGGSDKGIPFDELAESVTQTNVKHVLVLGETGPVIANLLRQRGFTAITHEGLETMDAAVNKAQELASQNDVVLLSTGCASFGMFKDYKDRGKQFNQAVAALPEAA
ncbi:MAG: UDP-N-acetylmuramoyl-L-alanine--D-glutamate ligase [bacterium]|nr:UDP-N-acetylmuramoyl-L-alanine--D-glutamate ligase [bacterium]